MTNWEDKIRLSVEIECSSEDRPVIAEALEIAVEELVSSWDKGSVGDFVVRVTG